MTKTQEIADLRAQLDAATRPSIVTGCSFVGVELNGSINVLAEAALQNANAIKVLGECIKASPVHIEAMIKVEN